MTVPPPVVVSVLFSARFVPVRLMPPAAVVLTAPFKVVVPEPADCVSVAELKVVAVTFVAEVRITSSSAVVPPTTPVKVTLPVPARSVRSCAPLSVLPKVMLPAPPAPVVTLTGPVSVVAEAKVTSSSVVITSPAVLIPPVAVSETAPSEVMSPAAARIAVPD